MSLPPIRVLTVLDRNCLPAKATAPVHRIASFCLFMHLFICLSVISIGRISLTCARLSVHAKYWEGWCMFYLGPPGSFPSCIFSLSPQPSQVYHVAMATEQLVFSEPAPRSGDNCWDLHQVRACCGELGTHKSWLRLP